MIYISGTRDEAAQSQSVKVIDITDGESTSSLSTCDESIRYLNSISTTSKPSFSPIKSVKTIQSRFSKSVREQCSTTEAQLREAEESNEGSSSDSVYEVEFIVDERIFEGQTQFLVQWKGYDEQTWEPFDNCKSAPKKIADFRRKQRELKRKSGSVATDKNSEGKKNETKKLKFVNEGIKKEDLKEEKSGKGKKRQRMSSSNEKLSVPVKLKPKERVSLLASPTRVRVYN